MKTLRIAAVLVILLCMSGCTVTKAFQDTPAPTFPSAGKEVITETKKAAKTIQEEAIKAAEKASEEMAKKADADEEKKTSSEGKSNPEPSKPTGSQGTPKSNPVPEKQSVPETVPEPELKPEPVPEPTPEPTPPPAPPQACPGGKNPDLGCEVILDSNYYRETFGSYNEAMARGQYYMDEVMYIGDIEITSYSVQEVYRNDHSVAYYGLNLWSNGSLIQ